MKNNRITVAFPVIALGVGGAEQQLLELVKGIDKSRFRPIVTPLYPGFNLEPEFKQIPGAEIIGLNRKGRYDFSILLTMYRILRRQRVDIIQPFLTPSTFFGLLPAVVGFTPVKIVTERCGVRLNTSLGNNLYRKAEDLLTRFADWVIPNSRAGEDYLIERGIKPSRIKVIYNGINTERLIPDSLKVTQIRESMGVPPDGKVVGITASLSPAKDHTTFLQAAKLIVQVMPKTRFSIVGQGPLQPLLENMVKELGLTSMVTFHGMQRDVGSYISAYDVACLCSADHEGCSNALLEAMALGKPVVATDIGGNKELVENGKNGLLVAVREPRALADAIIDLLRQPDRASELGNNAEQTVLTRFSLDHMVGEYEDLYEQAMEAKRGDKPSTS